MRCKGWRPLVEANSCFLLPAGSCHRERRFLRAYGRGDFDAVRQSLNAAAYRDLDSAGKKSFLDITYEVYSQRSDFPLIELAVLHYSLQTAPSTEFMQKYLEALIAALEDPTLPEDFDDGRGLVRLNRIRAGLTKAKGAGTGAPHELNGQLDVMGLYAARGLCRKQRRTEYFGQGLCRQIAPALGPLFEDLPGNLQGLRLSPAGQASGPRRKP